MEWFLLNKVFILENYCVSCQEIILTNVNYFTWLYTCYWRKQIRLIHLPPVYCCVSNHSPLPALLCNVHIECWLLCDVPELEYELDVKKQGPNIKDSDNLCFTLAHFLTNHKLPYHLNLFPYILKKCSTLHDKDEGEWVRMGQG